MTIFARLVLKYFLSNPQVVERLAALLLNGLIEHIAPSTAAGLVGEASASPLAGLPQVGGSLIGSPFAGSGGVDGGPLSPVRQ